MYLYSVPDRCGSYPCKNGGSCNNTFKPDDFINTFTEGFTCECSPGWAGATCTDKQGDDILFVISYPFDN